MRRDPDAPKRPRKKRETVKSVADKPAYAKRPDAPLSDNPKTILQLKAHECRWPVGPEHRDMAEQLFCADPTDGTWCSGHSALGYVTPTTTGNQLSRALRKYADR